MYARWEAELDTASTRVDGYRSRSQKESEPQPQPRSSTSIPSSMPARSHVSASIASSARVERRRPLAPVAGAVLEPVAEAQPEELGGHLVVLLVRLLRDDGDRLGA